MKIVKAQLEPQKEWQFFLVETSLKSRAEPLLFISVMDEIQMEKNKK